MTSTDLEVYEAPMVPVTLFGTDSPDQFVAAAAAVAKPLAKVIVDQKLFIKIGPSRHVRVEGWTLLGSMLGVFPITVWSNRLAATEGQAEGWEAKVEARTRGGDVVGAAEAMCTRDEKNWRGRDEYALRSMAQTRATSKALRQALGFVITLAGFDATPAEEMPRDDSHPTTDPAGSVFPDERSENPGLPVLEPDEVDPNLASPAQLKAIAALMGKLVAQDESGQMTRDTLKAEIQLAYGVTSSRELTRLEASEVIGGLSRRAG